MNSSGSQGGIYYGWWVLLTCVVGLSVGPAQFAFGSLGLFMLPMQEEFSWGRADISLSLTIFTTCLIFAMPVAGNLVDKYGSKIIILPALLVLGLSLASIPVFVENLWQLYLIFFVIGTLGAASNSMAFMLTISNWFDRKRGLAIGLAMAGSGLGYTYVPPLVEFVNSEYGWRYGYYVLAAIVLFIAIPLIAVLYRNKPSDLGLQVDGNAETESQNSEIDKVGDNRREAIRRPYFWQMFAIFTLLSFCLYGMMPHFVPMLEDRGIESNIAARAYAFLGITIMFARVIIGYLLDKFFAPYVACAAFMTSAFGVGILATGSSLNQAYVAAILIGFSIGAEVDLLAYIVSRYFGLKHFGEIFGLLFATMMIGVSLGPYTFGLCFDTLGNYKLILMLSCGMVIIASILTALLPAYPDLGDKPVS